MQNNRYEKSTNLRQVFDDATRNDPCSCKVAFIDCESAMYRARRKTQPIIPLSAFELSEMMSSTTFGKFYQCSVTCGSETGPIFFSKNMISLLADVIHIQFDGIFFTVPVQFRDHVRNSMNDKEINTSN